MNDYDLNEDVTLEATFGASPTTVTVVVVKPDGTLLDPGAPDSSAAPQYTVIVVADQVGTWSYRFIGTGAYTGVEEGYFVVRPSAVLDRVPLYTYDPSTPIGHLRLLIDDRDLSRVAQSVSLEQRSAVYSDAELDIFLTSSSDNVYLAASMALIVLANNRSLLVQSRRIADTTVDYGSIRSDLLKQAAEMRAIGLADGGVPGAPADGIVENVWTDFNYRRVLSNEAHRERPS